LKGLDVISEFYDVKAACSIKGTGICAVALGQTLADAVQKVLDSNPVDFMSSVIVVSDELDSEIARFLKESNIVVAPKYTKNALEILDAHNVTYVTINTPLKDYKKYLSNEIRVTPLGTLTQTPNLSELDKDSFKVVSQTKPSVEQIEDAVFAWKVAKHNNSQAIVIAKDLKTTAISQGLQSASVEFALDYSCDASKDAILASDMPITVHDVNVASQGRIGLIIVPFASQDVVDCANKYAMSVITTGFTNIQY
jgi:phosphoribosylaminoimidazolecarboxamide formyltransferase/IMP cyclohydrolase